MTRIAKRPRTRVVEPTRGEVYVKRSRTAADAYCIQHLDGQAVFASDDEIEANRKLFEHAPQLLEHARWVVRLFGTDHPEGIEDLKQQVAHLREVVGACVHKVTHATASR